MEEFRYPLDINHLKIYILLVNVRVCALHHSTRDGVQKVFNVGFSMCTVQANFSCPIISDEGFEDQSSDG